MLRILLIAAFAVFATHSFFAQSTHQDDLLAHPDYGNVITTNPKTPRISSKVNCNLNKTVFGWHPYWMNGAEMNYEWNLISDLCFFGYEVDAATGNATSTHGFATNDAVDTALVKGTKVHLCVTLFSNHATFFGNASAQNTLINNLVSLIQNRGAHGINIDFEGVPSSQAANLTNFMTNLGTALHGANPNYQLSICLYAVDWNNVFNEPVLNNSVDFYTIMGYDYYYSGSSQAGPTDPLYGFTNGYDYSLSRSVSYYLNAGIPASKLILGLPYYGREWETTSNAIPSATTGNNVSSRTYDFVKTNTSGNYVNPTTNTRASSKAYIFQNAGTWRQCWISEENELRDRYDLVNRRGLKGIGIWTLGYDDGYNQLWTAIEDKLTSCASWACSDTLFDEGGPEGSYYNNELVQYTISPVGATSLNVTFAEFATEANFDTLWLYDGTSVNAPLIGAFHGNTGPGSFSTSTGSLTVKFKSDGGTRATGWKMIYYCVQDNEAPSASTTNPNGWIIGNQNLDFTDSDNVAVEQRYWNAVTLDNNEWHGNQNTGHAFDDFTTFGNWNNVTGTWSILNSAIKQTDDALGNTNLSLSMPLTSSDEYVFEFKGSISGAGNNRRAGMHFMCSDLNLPNRGNSYFVWYRVDTDVIQLYKVTNDVFALTASFPYTLDTGTVYDSKITYSLVTGKMEVYVDNQYVGNWVDTSPLTLSNGISLRSGNAIFTIEEVAVFVGREQSELVFVGNNGHFYHSNPSPNITAGRVNNIVIDGAKNIGESSYFFDVDFTKPIVSEPQEQNPDTDTLLNTNILNLHNLLAADTNSGIAAFNVRVVAQNGTVVLPLQSVSNSSIFETLNGLSDQTLYYILVVATNNANLSDSVQSDGFIYLNTTSVSENVTQTLGVYPNPTSEQITISSSKMQQIVIVDEHGRRIQSQQLISGTTAIDCANWSAGNYFIIGQKEIIQFTKME